MAKVNIYVNGLNLYYGSVLDTPHPGLTTSL